MSWNPHEPKCTVRFIEKRSMAEITSEPILFQCLDNPSVQEQFQKYNAARERLYNAAAKQLRFNYKFKCVIMTQELLDEVAIVMTNPYSFNANIVGKPLLFQWDFLSWSYG
jgi:hypothetical protein